MCSFTRFPCILFQYSNTSTNQPNFHLLPPKTPSKAKPQTSAQLITPTKLYILVFSISDFIGIRIVIIILCIKYDVSLVVSYWYYCLEYLFICSFVNICVFNCIVLYCIEFEHCAILFCDSAVFVCSDSVIVTVFCSCVLCSAVRYIHHWMQHWNETKQCLYYFLFFIFTDVIFWFELISEVKWVKGEKWLFGKRISSKSIHKQLKRFDCIVLCLFVFDSDSLYWKTVNCAFNWIELKIKSCSISIDSHPFRTPTSTVSN